MCRSFYGAIAWACARLCLAADAKPKPQVVLPLTKVPPLPLRRHSKAELRAMFPAFRHRPYDEAGQLALRYLNVATHTTGYTARVHANHMVHLVARAREAAKERKSADDF